MRHVDENICTFATVSGQLVSGLVPLLTNFNRTDQSGNENVQLTFPFEKQTNRQIIILCKYVSGKLQILSLNTGFDIH